MSEAVSYPPDPDSFSRVDQLFLLCRSELERVAHSLMAKERKGHSLKSLDLLHEVYLRIRKARGLEIRNDVHFRRLMVRHMRWFLYTYASRNSVRKSSQIVGVDELDIELGGLNTERDPRRFLMLLDELAETSEEGARQAAYINMVFFVGISKGTAASRLGISDRQGRREWKEAKDWLEERLRGGPLGMSDEDRFERILKHALELSYEEGLAFIDAETKDDPRLRQSLRTEFRYEKTVRLGPRSTAEAGDGRGGTSAIGDRDFVGSFRVPQFVGRYEILEQLGKGGMGAVFKARHVFLENIVALKFFPQLREGDDRTLLRARREGRNLARLVHPNIARVYDLDDSSHDTPFLAMEYVPGETLAAITSRGALPRDTVIRYAIAIADALSTAHENDVVHRDLSSANVMVRPDGLVQVLDFGIAQRNGTPTEDTGSTKLNDGTNGAFGTRESMSPEQYQGLPTTEKTDVWALGALIHRCLTGDPAFPTGAPLSKNDAKAWPSSLGGRLGRIVDACLRWDPEERPSASEVRDRLEDLTVTKWARRFVPVGALMLVVFAIWAMSPRSAEWSNEELVLKTKIPGYSPAYHDVLPPPKSATDGVSPTKFVRVLPRPLGFFRQTLTTGGAYSGNNSKLVLLDWLGHEVRTWDASEILPGCPGDMTWRLFDTCPLPDGREPIFAPARSIQGPLTVYHSFLYDGGTLKRRGSLANIGHLEKFPSLDLVGDDVPEQFLLGWDPRLRGVDADSVNTGRSVLYAVDARTVVAQEAAESVRDVVLLRDPVSLEHGVVLGLSFALDDFNPHASSSCVSVRWGEPGELLVGVFGVDPGRAVDYSIEMEDGVPVRVTEANLTTSYRVWANGQGYTAKDIDAEQARLSGLVTRLTPEGWVSVPR